MKILKNEKRHGLFASLPDFLEDQIFFSGTVAIWK